MPNAAFTTLGCKVNQYETQRILDSFEAAGFGIVPFDSVADVYVINTCSVTSIAESKSHYTIRKASRTNPEAKIVVTGCAAQMALNRGESVECADLVVPHEQKLETLQNFARRFPACLPSPSEMVQTNLLQGQTHRTRAVLKIQDGCNVMCSYCSIPYTRPGLKSRPSFEVLDEARKMVELGYREIVLTGVLIGAYSPESGSRGPDFEDLVGSLSDLPGMGRIRISSIEMRQVTPRLIELVKNGKVVPHLHIPLQSGDSDVLAEMNRPYTQDDYLRLCERLYTEIPDISLTTDIMVGFPTETEERFESSLEVCRRAKFLKAHVFRFSPRFGTPADHWGDPISPQEKIARSAALAEISQKTGADHVQKFIGRSMRVLVEGKETKSGLLTGLTDNYVEVAFAGPSSLKRGFANVQIESTVGTTTYGELVSSNLSQIRILN